METRENSSSSSDSSRKRRLDFGAGASASAAEKRGTSSSSTDGSRKLNPEASSQSPGFWTRYTEDFVHMKSLGAGGYGKVYRCKHKLDESIYAVKMIPFKDEDHERVLREVRILAALQHPGIIRYYQCWIEEGIPDSSGSSEEQEFLAESTKTLFVVMEICDSTLHQKLKDKEKFLEKEVSWRYFGEILLALKCVHESGMVHGDVSRDNIFLNAKDQVKLGDFGLARKSGDNMTSALGNVKYRAPELLQDPKSISAKSDMYALGLVLYEMSYQMDTESERDQVFKVLKETGKVPNGQENCAVARIVDQLLHEDPMQRPSAADLIRVHFP